MRVGIIGLGFGGEVQLNAFSSLPDVKVTSITDSGSGRGRTFLEKYPGCQWENHWQSLVTSPNVDAVSIVTPPQTHFEIVKSALRAGKHVLCEKPFGLSPEEAENMVKIRADSGLVGAVDFQFRMEAPWQVLKKLMADSPWGSLKRIRVDWVTGGSSNPDRPWSWRNHAGLGGGTLNGIASHSLDYIEWLTQQRITSLVTLAQVTIPTRKDLLGVLHDCSAEDSIEILAKMDSGISCSLSVTNTSPFSLGHHIHLLFEKASVKLSWVPPFSPESLQLTVEKTLGQPIDMLSRESLFLAPPEVDSRMFAFRELAFKFITSIRENRVADDLPTFEDGLRAQNLMEAARKSSLSRTWVDVPKPDSYVAPYKPKGNVLHDSSEAGHHRPRI